MIERMFRDQKSGSLLDPKWELSGITLTKHDFQVYNLNVVV